MVLDFLKIASVIAPTAMPEDLFKDCLLLANAEYKNIIENVRNWIDFTSRFYAYSFFDKDDSGENFNIHDMVKRYLLFRLNNNILNIIDALSITLDKKFLPPNSYNRLEIDSFFNHVRSFLEYYENKQIGSSSTKLFETFSTANLCNNYAKCCELSGKYRKALKYYEFAKLIYEKINANKNTLGAIYNNLGLINSKLGKNTESMNFYKKALDCYE